MNTRFLLWGSSELARDLNDANYPTTLVDQEFLRGLEKSLANALIVQADSSLQEAKERLHFLSQIKLPRTLSLIFISHLKDVASLGIPRLMPIYAPVELPALLAHINLFPSKGLVREVEVSPQGAYGGVTLFKARTPEGFPDEIFEHPKREQLHRALRSIDQRDSWCGMHARRVSLVSEQVAKGLGVEGGDSIRTAGLLLHWSAGEHVRDDLTANERALDEFRERTIESAQKVQQQLEDEEASGLMLSIAEVARRSKNISHARLAHAAFGTEVIDRACWGRGTWDSRGAYHAVRILETENRFALPKDIIVALMRTIVEAIGCQRKQTVEIVEGGEVVPLHHLVPGMKLLRGLRAADGNQLVQAETELDFELVERIWRLSLVKHLPMQVVVSSAEAKT